MNENTKSYTDLAVEVNKEFNNGLLNSEKIKKKLKKLKSKDANFKDVYEVSDEVSDKMKKAFKEKITKDILPDGKMQKDIADSVIKANLKDGHKIISGYAADTQGLINKKQGINIKGIQAEFNEERCDNLINKLCDYDDYDKGKWLLVEPIKNFCNSVVDDAIEANADFLSKSGFKETITRSTNGGCCEWCEEVSGTFDYEYVKEWVRRDPKHNVFSRHRYCNCIISHNTEKGRKAVNNQWNEEKHKKEKRIEFSEAENLDKYSKKYTGASGAKNYFRDTSDDKHLSVEELKQEEHAYLMYDEIKNSNQKIEKRKIYNNIAKFEEMKDFSKKDVDIAFDHVFNDIHELDDGKGLFKPDFEMAQSWNRLIKDDGIKEHDLILLKHERLEHDLMYKEGMNYYEAHKHASKKYRYTTKRKVDK